MKDINDYISTLWRCQWGASADFHGELFPTPDASWVAFPCYSWARLPHAFQQNISLLYLHVKRSFVFREDYTIYLYPCI